MFRILLSGSVRARMENCSQRKPRNSREIARNVRWSGVVRAPEFAASWVIVIYRGMLEKLMEAILSAFGKLKLFVT